VLTSQDKLNSWKEIAAYLKCDESTARRWERRNNLPIHRVGKGGSVYAYAHEIEGWLRSQSVPAVDEQQSTGPSGPAAKVGVAREDSSSENSAATTIPFPCTAVMQPHRLRQLFSRWKFFLITASIVILIGLASWFLYISKHLRHATQPFGTTSTTQPEFSDTPVPEATVTELKERVKTAQIWEMLTLYSAPWNCDARNIERYWERGSWAFNDVLESTSRLNERGWHYGFGARLLNFEFRYVRLSRDGLSAEIGTREHWWLPVYTNDESLVTARNPDQGPYEIDYQLTKIDGQWYLKSENTPYSQWKPQHITCANWRQ